MNLPHQIFQDVYDNRYFIRQRDTTEWQQISVRDKVVDESPYLPLEQPQLLGQLQLFEGRDYNESYWIVGSGDPDAV